MAHMINDNDGMVLVGKPAWHGLGKVLPHGVTPSEALKIGGMDWLVEESVSLGATFVNDDGTSDRMIVDSHKTLRRSDDKSILATVGADYCVLQNHRLAEIAESLGAEGKIKVETAGTLNGGRRQFFLIKSDMVDIGGREDWLEEYLLLANSHDGSLSVTSFPTSTRVVCANTLTIAIGEMRNKAKNSASSGAYRWKHTSGLSLRIDDIKSCLWKWSGETRSNRDAFNAMAKKSLSRDEIQSLWTDVLVELDGPISVNPKTEVESRRKAKAVSDLAYMSRVFDVESQKFGASTWVAANAATNLIQHERGTLKGEARVNADLFGAYGDAKRIAFKKALALV